MSILANHTSALATTRGGEGSQGFQRAASVRIGDVFVTACASQSAASKSAMQLGEAWSFGSFWANQGADQPAASADSGGGAAKQASKIST
jgi:hypothetical protein